TSALGNGGPGVTFANGSHDNILGMTAGSGGNTIAFNGGEGVRLTGSTTVNNAIRGNSIYSNAALGIDLNSAGVTLNDVGDPDTGPNNLQNFPVITGAQSDTATTTNIQGTLNSTGSMTYTLDFFSTAPCDLSVFGEGAAYLGSTNVTTSHKGNA